MVEDGGVALWGDLQGDRGTAALSLFGSMMGGSRVR